MCTSGERVIVQCVSFMINSCWMIRKYCSIFNVLLHTRCSTKYGWFQFSKIKFNDINERRAIISLKRSYFWSCNILILWIVHSFSAVLFAPRYVIASSIDVGGHIAYVCQEGVGEKVNRCVPVEREGVWAG